MAPRKQPGKRRKPGTGTIRWKQARAQWEAAFPLGHGRYRYDYFSARSEAEAHLDRLTAERDSQEQPRNIAGGSQRVDVFLIGWLGQKAPHIKPKTLENYQYLCELASGEIGGYRLDEVSREVTAEMLNYFHGRGFQNVSQMRAVLHQAFAYAVDEEYIKRNPFARVRSAPVERRAAVALTEGARAALLAAVVGDPFEALYHLYSRLGLRRGEGLGLRWSDIDWSAGTISIEQQYTAVGGKVTRGTPKTKRSRRTVPVPRDILTLLDKLPRSSDLVFHQDGEPINPHRMLRRLRAALKRAALPRITLHDLRHTALYLMEASGAAQSAVQAIAGHSSATMTRHYTDHAGLAEMRRAIEYRPASSA